MSLNVMCHAAEMVEISYGPTEVVSICMESNI